MNDLAVDSSVVAKWALLEPDSAQAMRLLSSVAGGQVRLIVLDLALMESANAILIRRRRGIISVDDARMAFDFLTGVGVEIHAGLPFLPRAFDVAGLHGLAVYDAIFVALAEYVGAGVTADVKLHAAVRADFPTIVLLRDWAASPPP